MFRFALIAAVALASSACTPAVTSPTSPGSSPAPVEVPTTNPTPSTGSPLGDAVVRGNAAVDRAWNAYLVIRGVADLVEPFLSPARQANLQALQVTIEGYFLKARLATTLADQARQLQLAVGAAAKLDAVVTDPD